MSAIRHQEESSLVSGQKNLSEYDVCGGCMFLTCSIPPYSWFVAPCMRCRVQSQEVYFEGNNLHFKYDCCLHAADKLIPLDRIQDINIEATCCSRLCNVNTLNVQTANGSQLPEAVIVAPRDAQALRSAIMTRRDQIVYNGQPSSSGVDDVSRPLIVSPHQPSESKQDLQDMNRSLARIEQLMERGLLQLEKMQR